MLQQSPLEIIGLVTLFYWFVYRLLKFLTNWLLDSCSSQWKRILLPGSMDYAVVTGATDGIGLEYARQLAARGYRLALLSRSQEKLNKVAQEIQEQYPQCQTVSMNSSIHKLILVSRSKHSQLISPALTFTIAFRQC